MIKSAYMHTLVASEGTSHLDLFAQSQVLRGNTVGLYTATPTFKLKGWPKDFGYHFIPSPAHIVRGLMRNRVSIPRVIYDYDCILFDKVTAMLIEDSDLLLGAASSSLATGKAAKRKGGKYVLDRACPDIRVQEKVVGEEAAKAGGIFVAAPQWFLERQVEEYEEADFIVLPSDYSRRSLPPHLQSKALIVPLIATLSALPAVPVKPARPFTVGVVGGNPLRKGYLYLAQAWKELGWTDARLLMRTSERSVGEYPVIANLVKEQPTISFVNYVPNIADFFFDCDAFILPSIDDGFGMAFFEALGHGVPSIATRNCGSSEQVTPDKDFLLIDAFSVEAIKESLTRLKEDAELRARLAESGLRTIHSHQVHFAESAYKKGIDALMDRAFPSNEAATA